MLSDITNAARLKRKASPGRPPMGVFKRGKTDFIVSSPPSSPAHHPSSSSFAFSSSPRRAHYDRYDVPTSPTLTPFKAQHVRLALNSDELCLSDDLASDTDAASIAAETAVEAAAAKALPPLVLTRFRTVAIGRKARPLPAAPSRESVAVRLPSSAVHASRKHLVASISGTDTLRLDVYGVNGIRMQGTHFPPGTSVAVHHVRDNEVFTIDLYDATVALAIDLRTSSAEKVERLSSIDDSNDAPLSADAEFSVPETLPATSLSTEFPEHSGFGDLLSSDAAYSDDEGMPESDGVDQGEAEETMISNSTPAVETPTERVPEETIAYQTGVEEPVHAPVVAVHEPKTHTKAQTPAPRDRSSTPAKHARKSSHSKSVKPAKHATPQHKHKESAPQQKHKESTPQPTRHATPQPTRHATPQPSSAKLHKKESSYIIKDDSDLEEEYVDDGLDLDQNLIELASHEAERLKLDVLGMLANAIVFHHLSTVPVDDIVESILSDFPAMREASIDWAPFVEHTLRSNAMYGIIENKGLKDASGNLLKPNFFYLPENDPSSARVQALEPFTKRVRGARTQGGGKRYFWRKPKK